MDDPALLSRQVYQSEAYQIFIRIQTLNGNYFVFQRNYQELHRLIAAAQNPDAFFDLWTQDKAPEMNMIMNELARLFHNFLASAKMLIDHTRALIDDWYKNTKFSEEYQIEIQKRFVGNLLAGFIEDLRNYALHFRLPLSRAVVQLNKDMQTNQTTLSQTFVLDKSELMEWSKWTKKGKLYLDAVGNEIAVKDIASRYFQEVNNFQMWIIKQLENIHADELRWLNEMEQKVNNALNSLHVSQNDSNNK